MEFYAYMWLREDGTPYYVGKGCGPRAYVKHEHIYPPPKDRIVLIPCGTEAESLAQEVALIDIYRRKDDGTGILRNMTDGGDGISGLHHTEETKEKCAAARRGKPSWNKGVPMTEEAKEKLCIARSKQVRTRKGIPQTAETKLKISLAKQGKPSLMKGKHQTPEAIANLSAALRGRTLSAEHRQHISEAGFRRWARIKQNG